MKRIERGQSRRNLRKRPRDRQREVFRARVRTRIESGRTRYGALWWFPWFASILATMGVVTLAFALRPRFEANLHAALRADAFRVHSVEIQGAHDSFARDIVRALELPAGTPLLDLDLAALRQRLRAQPRVADAILVRLPPSHLLVKIEERVPFARVRLPKAETDYLVDREGKPYTPASKTVGLDASQLPILRGVSNLKRNAANPQLAAAVEIAQRMAQRDIPHASEIFISTTKDPEQITLILDKTGQRVLLRQSSYTRALDAFSRLLTASPPEYARATEIDLRFRNQVVLRGVPPSEGGEKSGGVAGIRASVHNRASGETRSSRGGMYVTQR